MTPRYQPEGATSEMSGVDGGHHAAVTSSPVFRRGFRSRAVLLGCVRSLNERESVLACDVAVGLVVPLSSEVSVLLFGGHRAAQDRIALLSVWGGGHRGLGPQKLDTTSSWRFEAFPVLPKFSTRDLAK
eukprot:scaffold6177_cov165-Skeletonema_marinoi.AAC.4